MNQLQQQLQRNRGIVLWVEYGMVSWRDVHKWIALLLAMSPHPPPTMTVTLPTTQRVWTLTQLPAGLPDDSTFTLSTKALPELQPEQALVRLEYFSNDPVVRFRLPLFPIGEPVPIWGVGTVLKSTGKWKEGDSVFGNFGWYDVGVVDDKEIRCVAA